MKVLIRITGHGSGWVFTPSDFADLGTSQAVRLALMNAEKNGEIRRLARGLYHVPRQHPELGALSPSPDAIAEALQSRDAIRLQPTGAYAANLLGLSDQVPARIVFFTDGRSRTVQIGKQQIVLRHRSSRAMATAGKLSGLIIHALDFLGRNLVDEVLIEQLRRKLTRDVRARLLDDVRYAPSWIGDVMRRLAIEATKSDDHPQIDAPTVAEEYDSPPPPLEKDRRFGAAESHHPEVFESQDLAGNGYIAKPQPAQVIVQGNAPKRQPRGRKKNLFAPLSSRVAHWLLLHSAREWTAREIGEATGIDSGHLSRILARLCELSLVLRDGRSIRLSNPATLLKAWREAYTPPCGNILKGVVPGRSGQQTMMALEKRLREARRRYAFSGLAAASVWGGQGDFRLTTCYLDGKLSSQLKRKLGFVELDGDATNVWIMEHADQVAFLGSERRLQTQVASPIFTHVDLAIHPEGAKEAAAHLRESVLKL